MGLADQLEQLAEIYLANADYSATGDCAKARIFESTLRKLLIVPSQAFHAQESISFQPTTWHELLRDVQSWIGGHCTTTPNPDANVTNSSSGGATYFDCSNFRS